MLARLNTSRALLFIAFPLTSFGPITTSFNLPRKCKVVKRLSSQLPFAARQGSRAKEWLSFLAQAVADARPPAVASASSSVAATSPLTELVHAAAAALDEQANALRNHPNAKLYAAISRLVPGAGEYLEMEPCLVCLGQDRRAAKGAASTATASTAIAAAMAGSASVASTAGGGGIPGETGLSSMPGSGGIMGPAGAGTSIAGGGSLFLNYPLDSIKSSSKSTENAMLVRYFVFFGPIFLLLY